MLTVALVPTPKAKNAPHAARLDLSDGDGNEYQQLDGEHEEVNGERLPDGHMLDAQAQRDDKGL